MDRRVLAALAVGSALIGVCLAYESLQLLVRMAVDAVPEVADLTLSSDTQRGLVVHVGLLGAVGAGLIYASQHLSKLAGLRCFNIVLAGLAVSAIPLLFI